MSTEGAWVAPGAQNILASCKDDLGRTVVLAEDRWHHILNGHPEMHGLHLAVMRVVEDADTRLPGNKPGSMKVYKEDLGPARWLVAIIMYENAQGKVITAYPCSKEPKAAS